MSVIDILRCRAGTITVNAAADSVSITPTDAFFSLGLLTALDLNDNVNLISAWVVLPYCFCVADVPLVLQLQAEMEAAPFTQGEIYGLGSDGGGRIHIPVENVETFLDINIPWDQTAVSTQEWGFTGNVTGDLSMVNVPAQLDTDTIDIYAFIKILHNLPLV